MGIKLGSVITAIIFLFIAKISFEASMDLGSTPQVGATTASSSVGRSPASINSIDEGYAQHINGPQKRSEQH